MGRLSNLLFGIARSTGNASTKIRDVEVLLSGDPKKIAKRMMRKTVYKQSNKTARRVSRLFK